VPFELVPGLSFAAVLWPEVALEVALRVAFFVGGPFDLDVASLVGLVAVDEDVELVAELDGPPDVDGPAGETLRDWDPSIGMTTTAAAAKATSTTALNRTDLRRCRESVD